MPPKKGKKGKKKKARALAPTEPLGPPPLTVDDIRDKGFFDPLREPQGGAQPHLACNCVSVLMASAQPHPRSSPRALPGSAEEREERERRRSRLSRCPCRQHNTFPGAAARIRPPSPRAASAAAHRVVQEMQEAAPEDLNTSEPVTLTTPEIVRLLKRYGLLVLRLNGRNEPIPSDVYVRLSTLKAALQMYEEAAEDAQRAIDDRPTNAVAYYRLGCARYFMSDFSGASEAFLLGLKYEKGNLSLERGLYLSIAKARSRAHQDGGEVQRQYEEFVLPNTPKKGGFKKLPPRPASARAQPRPSTASRARESLASLEARMKWREGQRARARPRTATVRSNLT